MKRLIIEHHKTISEQSIRGKQGSRGIRGSYYIVRDMLDEVVDMMKESAKKKGDAVTLEALEPALNIRGALDALRGRRNGVEE